MIQVDKWESYKENEFKAVWKKQKKELNKLINCKLQIYGQVVFLLVNTTIFQHCLEAQAVADTDLVEEIHLFRTKLNKWVSLQVSAILHIF